MTGKKRDLVPTRITDKNGRRTTVHKKPEGKGWATGSAAVPARPPVNRSAPPKYDLPEAQKMTDNELRRIEEWEAGVSSQATPADGLRGLAALAKDQKYDEYGFDSDGIHRETGTFLDPNGERSPEFDERTVSLETTVAVLRHVADELSAKWDFELRISDDGIVVVVDGFDSIGELNDDERCIYVINQLPMDLRNLARNGYWGDIEDLIIEHYYRREDVREESLLLTLDGFYTDITKSTGLEFSHLHEFVQIEDKEELSLIMDVRDFEYIAQPYSAYERKEFDEGGFSILTGLNEVGLSRSQMVQATEHGIDADLMRSLVDGERESDGFDSEGYDRDGFNRNGLSRTGFQRNGFNPEDDEYIDFRLPGHY